jgi:hypothetical protein
MSLIEYFENVEGIGVLGTADAAGKVDVALYARPHVLDENTVAFIMSDHLSHDNLSSNPHAAYLFVERGEAYNGVRMYLTRTHEETDPEKIESLRRKSPGQPDYTGIQKFLVHFKVDEVRRLVGP